MTFEMPEPFGEVIESRVFENGTLWAICAAKGLFLPGTKVYTAQALRDILEQIDAEISAGLSHDASREDCLNLIRAMTKEIQ
jgi:hypothetical protein